MKKIVMMTDVLEDRKFPIEDRKKIGRLLEQLQNGATLPMPISRPMPDVGKGCYELRIRDFWRVVYKIDSDAIVVLDIFPKKTQTMPQQVINTCQARLKKYYSSKEKVGNYTILLPKAKLAEVGAKVYNVSWQSVGLTRAEHEAEVRTESYRDDMGLLRAINKLQIVRKQAQNHSIKTKLGWVVRNLGASFVWEQWNDTVKHGEN
jgi:phage-related protein